MNWRSVTKVLLVVSFVLLAGYDVAAFVRGGVEATVSRVVLGWAEAAPLFPLAVGVVRGHLFWPQRPACPECSARVRAVEV